MGMLNYFIIYNIMPYKQIKVKGGYKNKNTATGKLHSKNPMTKKNADSQLRILKMTEKKKI
jgi:hypothetical protein